MSRRVKLVLLTPEEEAGLYGQPLEEEAAPEEQAGEAVAEAPPEPSEESHGEEGDSEAQVNAGTEADAAPPTDTDTNTPPQDQTRRSTVGPRGKIIKVGPKRCGGWYDVVYE